MSLLEDVFLENEAGEAQELERIIEGDEFDERPRSRSDSDENSAKEDEAEEDKRCVDPTSAKPKRAIRNPRFVLNPARLTGPRGIQIVTEHFKDFKFKGKGHEKEDLDLVLKKLEHWAYRLYPKFQFEDCLKKIETLGRKRAVAVHLHRIRMDQILSDETVVQKDSSDDEAPPAQEPAEDEFDKLLQQQIEIARATPAPGSIKKTIFSDRSSLMPKATSSPSINDEQRERMLRNRRMAEERRLARLNQNMTQESTKSSTKPDDVSKESRNKSVLDSSDDDEGRNKSVTDVNGSKSDIIDVDDMVTKSPRCYIPAKKHKPEINSRDDGIRESVTIEAHNSNTNQIVELDDDGKVVTKLPKRYEPAKKHNKSRIDSSDDDDALVINEFDDGKHQNSRAKSKNLSNKTISDDDLAITESVIVDVENHHYGNARHSRSNVIDSSDSEDEPRVMNESITVDIHGSNKYDIESNTHVSKDNNKTNSNNNDVFDSLKTTEKIDEPLVMNKSITVDIHDSNKNDNESNTHVSKYINNEEFHSLKTTEKINDVILEDYDGIGKKSEFQNKDLSYASNNDNTNCVTDDCNNTKIGNSIEVPIITKVAVDNISETQKLMKSKELQKNYVRNDLVEDDEVMDVDFSDDF